MTNVTFFRAYGKNNVFRTICARSGAFYEFRALLLRQYIVCSCFQVKKVAIPTKQVISRDLVGISALKTPQIQEDERVSFGPSSSAEKLQRASQMIMQHPSASSRLPHPEQNKHMNLRAGPSGSAYCAGNKPPTRIPHPPIYP